MLRLEQAARRWRGRAKRKLLGVVRVDTKLVVLREEDAEYGCRWRQMIG